MEEVTKTKGVEIARLTAQLRKAEMMVSSLERQVDQKVGGQFDHKSYFTTKNKILLNYILIIFPFSDAGEPGTDNNL